MSPLVTRPSLPEPGTVAASTPLSAESFRTDGASGASDGGAFAAAAGAAVAAGAAAAALAGAAPRPGRPAPPALFIPSSAPTPTGSPSFSPASPAPPAHRAGAS